MYEERRCIQAIDVPCGAFCGTLAVYCRPNPVKVLCFSMLCLLFLSRRCSECTSGKDILFALTHYISYLCDMNNLERIRFEMARDSKNEKIASLDLLLRESWQEIKEYRIQAKKTARLVGTEIDPPPLITGKPRRRYLPGVDARYKRYLFRAEDKGLTFELTEDQFIEMISKPCTYCGGPGGTIDRIDSSIGYIPCNVCPCCWPCNRFKHTGTVNDMMNHIRSVYHHNSLGNDTLYVNETLV